MYQRTIAERTGLCRFVIRLQRGHQIILYTSFPYTHTVQNRHKLTQTIQAVRTKMLFNFQFIHDRPFMLVGDRECVFNAITALVRIHLCALCCHAREMTRFKRIEAANSDVRSELIYLISHCVFDK